LYNSGNANITQKALTLSGITASDKVYDGTTTATVNATLGGLISGDSVSIASTFDNPNVGVAKTVTLNSLAGTDGANYSATLGQTTLADITTNPTLKGVLVSIANGSATSNRFSEGNTPPPIPSIGGLSRLQEAYNLDPLLTR